MKVSEVMRTPVVSIGPKATLKEAATLMADRNVGCLVVLDRTGLVTGVVTDRDIAVRGVARGESFDDTVESVMTRDVAVIWPQADIREAQEIMQKRGVRRLPVADDMFRPHGLIAMDDIVRTVDYEMDVVADTLRDQSLRRTV